MSALKKGAYSAIYLLKTAKILKKEKKELLTEVQFFQREHNITLCGIKHSLEILKKESYNYKSLKIFALNDGDIIKPNEPVLKIVGNLWKFIHLEGVIDGILARESSIATKSKNLISLTDNNRIIYMNDRSDYYLNHEWDGYAAYVGGIRKFVTHKQISLLKDKKDVSLVGTVPHSLIQSYKGDLISSLYGYSKHISSEKIVGLVDYNNDVINDSLKLANEFKEKLHAVRVDTSLSLIDKTLEEKYGQNDKINKINLQGVNLILAQELRDSLDKHGFSQVKIIFSSGLNYKKIKKLESQKAPVDLYGVGGYFSSGKCNFTCDAVKINGIEESKFGRKNIENKRLRLIK